MVFRTIVSLVATVLSSTALAQTSPHQTNATSAAASAPVAYVYVSRPTHIDAFAAASNGRLTPVPGSPFANIAVNNMSVNKKFLFGAGEDGDDIYSFSIASNGSIKPIDYIYTHRYDPEDQPGSCYGVGPIFMDNSGSTVYNYAYNCDGNDQFVQSFKIESNGELTYVGIVNSGPQEGDGLLSIPQFLGNNRYTYQTGCDSMESNFEAIALKRASNGALDSTDITAEAPKGETSSDVYCSFSGVAGDPANHLAMAVSDVNGGPNAPTLLASFTADSSGNLTTTSTYSNMPATGVAAAYLLSIDPTGKLLAVGGGSFFGAGSSQGFQVFRFNGAKPITHFTGVLQSNVLFTQFAWDQANHLYALGGNALRVYTVTPTSIVEAPGSPISIPESSSVTVLPLN